MKLATYLHENKIVTLLAILHYRTRGQSAPCRNADEHLDCVCDTLNDAVKQAIQLLTEGDNQ